MPHWLNKDRPAVGVYDAIRKCTAFIGMDSERGFDPHGTGFFVAVQHDGYEFGYLVTAAHLIRDARYSPYVRINKKDGSSEVQPAKSDDWIFHHDRRMDICALPSTIYSLDDDDPHDILFMDIVTFALSGDRINRAGIAIGDEIFIANLFASRGGDRRNIPIIRIGNIAAMPEEPLYPPSPRPAYLIETRSLGGTSGAPIFYNYTQTHRVNPVVPPVFGILQAETGVRIMPYGFVGMILSSHGGNYPSDFATPGEARAADSEYNSGISVAMAASDVVDFLGNDPGLKDQRARRIGLR